MAGFFLMKYFFALIALLCSSKITWSQASNYKSEFGFRSDNDSFLAIGQDQYYTNGIFLSFKHALKAKKQSPLLAKKIWELEAGQLMFNPNTGQINNISEVDRPFAAYLFAGAKFHWLFQNEQIVKVSLQVGTIGPNALGKEIQEGLHKAIGFYTIRGWESQVANERSINISAAYTKLLTRHLQDNDLSLESYARVGNAFTGAGAGLLFRAGSINKLFSSVSTDSRISHGYADTIPAKEIFFFTRPMLNFIGYDATVQGGYFTENKGPITFDPKRFQYSQEVGINYAKDHWTLSFSITFKSRDTKAQEKPHQYGSAFIYYRF
jgi:lipid A 3-O-deacylase